MKQLTIITRREKLDIVKNLLQKKYACGMTVTNVQGCGNQEGFGDSEGVRLQVNRVMDISLMDKIQVDTVVKDSDTEAIINDLCDALYTGKYGDGKIFVKPIEDAIRIRTRERGEDALDTIYRNPVK